MSNLTNGVPFDVNCSKMTAMLPSSPTDLMMATMMDRPVKGSVSSAFATLDVSYTNSKTGLRFNSAARLMFSFVH